MLPFTLCPEATYATKPNIVFPGTQDQATAAEAIADARLEDAFDGGGLDNINITLTGSIEPGTP